MHQRLPAAPRAQTRACTPCAQAEAAGGNSARAHYRRGMALVQLGRPDEAAAAFRAGLASSPGSARLAAALAAAEAAARAGFQQRRAAAGAAAQDTRRASAELQARPRSGLTHMQCVHGRAGALRARALPPSTSGSRAWSGRRFPVRAWVPCLLPVTWAYRQVWYLAASGACRCQRIAWLPVVNRSQPSSLCEHEALGVVLPRRRRGCHGTEAACTQAGHAAEACQSCRHGAGPAWRLQLSAALQPARRGVGEGAWWPVRW